MILFRNPALKPVLCWIGTCNYIISHDIMEYSTSSTSMGFTMKETRSRLEENFYFLSEEMDTLKELRDKLACTNAHVESWFIEVKDKQKEFEALQYEFSGFKEFEAAYLGYWVRINRRVLDLLKSVNDLKELGSAVSETIRALVSELTGDKPKRFSSPNLCSFTSNFSDNADVYCSGNVYKGQFPNGVQLVVNILPEIDTDEEIFMAEVNKMFSVCHRNLVKLYGFCFEENTKALVFEYIPNGSLDRILFDNSHTDMGWERLYDIATETAKGLSYLHDGCVDQLPHGDLRASNVLLDSNMCPKVTNFGVLKLMGKNLLTHLTMSKICGDGSYPAPELMQSSRITQKCDVYSFGMMLFEVLGKRRIVSRGAFFPRFLWNKFEQGVEEIITECCIAEKNREKAMILCMVAFWCIQYTPENRPSMTTVIKMLEYEIKVEKPPSPFFPDLPYSMKPFLDVIYESSDFEHQRFLMF